MILKFELSKLKSVPKSDNDVYFSFEDDCLIVSGFVRDDCAFKMQITAKLEEISPFVLSADTLRKLLRLKVKVVEIVKNGDTLTILSGNLNFKIPFVGGEFNNSIFSLSNVENLGTVNLPRFLTYSDSFENIHVTPNGTFNIWTSGFEYFPKLKARENILLPRKVIPFGKFHLFKRDDVIYLDGGNLVYSIKHPLNVDLPPVKNFIDLKPVFTVELPDEFENLSIDGGDIFFGNDTVSSGDMVIRLDVNFNETALFDYKKIPSQATKVEFLQKVNGAWLARFYTNDAIVYQLAKTINY